jgi:phosphohistidine phosphatase
MLHLMLLRHAKTERAKPGERDRDRKLTVRGRSDAPMIGAYMARHRLVPELALVSPAVRAQETWSLLAPAFAPPPPLITDERIYNAGTEKLFDVVGGISGVGSLLVVGHNPGLHDLAVLLLASGDIEARARLGDGLPTTGLVVIDFDADDWSLLQPRTGRLACFMTPRLIAGTTE